MLWTLGTILGHITLRAQRGPADNTWLTFVMPLDAIAVFGIGGSLGMWLYTRKAANIRRSLDLGLAYLIAISFGLGLMFHVGLIFYADRMAEALSKVAMYLEAGVRLVWLVDPDGMTITVFRPDRAPNTLGEGDTLDGGDVIPGFSVEGAEIFAED